MFVATAAGVVYAAEQHAFGCKGACAFDALTGWAPEDANALVQTVL